MNIDKIEAPELQPARKSNRKAFYFIAGAILLFLFIIAILQHDPATQTVGKARSIIPNIQSPGLQYQGINLTDHTVINESSNVCTASRLGMNITVYPCVAQDADGKAIEQYVDFNWNGGAAQNTSWIFVYDGGQLASESLSAWMNQSTTSTVSVPVNTWITNYLIDRVVSFTNLGSPDNRCQLGNRNNTQMFNVTRTMLGLNTTTSQVICFTNSTTVNATAFRISGNYDNWVNQQVNGSAMTWVDVTAQVQHLGNGLLQDNRSYYRVQNVVFQPGQTIKTKWIYTPQNVSLVGKWHILGYNANTGLTQSIVQNQYIYLDPWWDANWLYRKALNLSLGSHDNEAFRGINITLDHATPTNCTADIRLLNASLDEKPFTVIEGSNSTFCPLMITARTGETNFYVYYGNPAANTPAYYGQGGQYLNIGGAWGARYNYYNGTAKDGTLSGGAYYINNQFGVGVPAIRFNQTMGEGYVSFGTSAMNGAKTIDGWYKVVDRGANPAFLFAKDSSSSEDGYLSMEPSSNNFRFARYNGGWESCDWTTTPALANNTWHHIAWLSNSSLYIDGVAYIGSGTCNGFLSGGDNFATPQDGDSPSHAVGFPGFFSNWRQTNSLLSSFACLSGTPCSYSLGAEEANNGVSINLISPLNGIVTNNQSFIFNATETATGSSVLNNATIFIWNATDNVLKYSNTQAISGITNETIWQRTMEEGSWIWGARVTSTTNEIAWSSNRTFLVDTSIPTITIVLPTNGTEYATLTAPYNVSVNYTITDNGALSVCWFNNETANVTIPCGQNASALYGAGYHTIGILANDTAGNLAQTFSTFLINLIQPNVSFQNPVVESQPFNVTFNITAGLINSINATLNYNGTLIPMNVAQSNSTFASLTVNTTAPFNISANTLMSVIVNYTLNGNSYVTPQQNQTVLFLTPIIIATSCNDKSMAFNVLDEQNLTGLTVDVAYNFQYGVGDNSSLKAVYGNLTSAANFYICINSTVSNAYVIGSGEIDYQATGQTHVLRRYYTFTNKILSNVTENVTLYDLSNAAATSFLIEAKDNTLTPYVEKYLGLLRWYPQLNTYNLVEMAQTDANGRSIMRVRVEDVDYRVALWHKNGTLIKLNDVTRFACLTQPCTYSFTVIPGSQDFTSITGIQQSLTFNETSGKFQYIWNDPSGRTQTMNMTVYHTTGINVGPICESIGTGPIGSLQSCDVSGYTGNVEAQVFRSASPATPIANLIQTLGDAISSISRDMGLFLTIILAVAGFFIGIPNPVLGIIIQIVALIPSLFLGAVTISIIIGFAIMGSVVLHFIKRLLGG